jgi:exoribonuclease R
MLTSAAHSREIDEGIARLRLELGIPERFPAEVLAAATRARHLAVGSEHIDRTDLPFITLDPARSTDLDQAFCIETSGADLVLRYAIADVGWFVQSGDLLDREAWQRGTTMYAPDGKTPLYPPELSEGAASLLPDGPRPAVVFIVRLDDTGTPRLDGVERAMVHSRAKLGYETVTAADLPVELAEFARRMAVGDAHRGAARVEPPEQEVVRADGGYRMAYRPKAAVEAHNASLSLATNLAVAAALYEARTGLYRVLDAPDERRISRLRHTARALRIDWPRSSSLADVERTLHADDPRHAAFMLAIRRAGGAARYVPYEEGEVPWHAAMAATYVHATAPLRRLADRAVVLAALAVANGRPVPDDVQEAFAALPAVMERADATGNRLDRTVLDLVEAVVLQERVGEVFDAVVTDLDERGARIQLCDVAVVARVATDGVEPGDTVEVRLVETSPERRLVRFERVSPARAG